MRGREEEIRLRLTAYAKGQFVAVMQSTQKIIGAIYTQVIDILAVFSGLETMVC